MDSMVDALQEQVAKTQVKASNDPDGLNFIPPHKKYLPAGLIPTNPIGSYRMPTKRPHRLRVETLESRALPSTGPVLVKDINPGSGGSSTAGFASLGGNIYFRAGDGSFSGNVELWQSDGTAAGTVRVADIFSGADSSTPQELAAFNGQLFFSAINAGSDRELWKHDPVAGTTSRVKDIRVGANGSSPALLTEAGDRLYLTATTAAEGLELWTSDGTDAGTTLVADLAAGSASSAFSWLREVDGRLFAARSGGSGGTKVYRAAADGSGVTEIHNVGSDSHTTNVAVIGTKLYYVTSAFGPRTLWVIDAAATNPVAVSLGVFTNLGNLSNVNDTLFFAGESGSTGSELWTSDGTVAGTRLVADISQDTPGNNPSSSPGPMVDVDGIAFFAATTIAGGRELYRSDGTEAGTYRVVDLVVGDSGSSPLALTAVGNTVVFGTLAGSGSGGGASMWQHDPAADTTTEFAGFRLADSFGNEFSRGLLGDTLFFPYAPVSPSIGQELFKLDVDPSTPAILDFSDDTGDPDDGITADATPTLSGTGRFGLDVRVYDGVVLLGETPVAVDGTWTFTTPALLNGPHVLTATAVNTSGAESEPSAPLTVTVDTLAPSTPAITGFADNTGSTADSITSDPTPILSGTAEAGTVVTILRGGNPIGSTTAAGGTWAFTVPALSDGTHVFTATAGDIAGNQSPATANFPITVDTVAPAAPAGLTFSTDSGTAGDGLTNDGTPTVSGTAEPGVTVRVLEGATLLGQGTANAQGAWSATITLADGPHTLSAVAVDLADNVSPMAGPLSITVDSVAPAVPVIASFADNTGSTADSVTADATPTLSGTAESGTVITVLRSGTPIGTTTAAAGAWTFVVPALLDGTHVFTAVSADAAGNETPTAGGFPITVDTALPTAPANLAFAPDSGAVGDGVTRFNALTVSGTAEAGAVVRVSEGVTQLGQATASAQGTWSVAVTLADGAHALTAVATDTADNASPASVPLAVTVDSAAPATPVITGFTVDSGVPGDGLTNDTTPTLTGTAASGDLVRLYDGATFLAETTSNGTWSLTATPLADGARTLRVVAADAAGNESAADTLAVDIDATKPVAVVDALPAYSSPPAFAVSWAVTDGSRAFAGTTDVFVSVDDGAWTQWLSDTTATTAEYPAEVGRDYRFYAAATDAAGNAEDPTPVSEAETSTKDLVVAGEVYPADPNRTRKVNAKKGLLADDARLPGSTYVVELIEGPTDGTLTLKPTGAFKYVADPTFPGVDRFTYRVVKDGVAGPVTEATLATQIVQFKKSTLKAREGSRTYTVAVILRKPAPAGFTVDYAVVPGTATAADHDLASGVLSFVAGKKKALLTFTVAADAVAEGTESFRVELSAATAGVVGMKDVLTVSLLDG